MDSSSSTPNKSKTTTGLNGNCKGCEEKDERIQKISDGIKQKIQAYTELSSEDCPLPVSHLITSVLSVLKKFNPSETETPKKEEQHHDTNAEQEDAENGNITLQEPQINTPVKTESRTSSSSSSLPLSTSEFSKFGDRKRKRKLSTSSSASSSCSTHTLPVKKQLRRIQTPDISSSCSSPRPAPSSAIPGPSRKIKLEERKKSTNLRQSLVQIPVVSTLNPVEGALKIPKVLKNIFKCLNFDDLQSCCTMGEWKEWKEQAEIVMSRRTRFTISISKTGPKVSMAKSIHDNHIRSNYRDINQLSTALEAEERGNEIWISVHHLDLSSPSLSSFLQKFAPDITRLTLFYGVLNKMSPQSFHQLLLSLPHVTQLSLATLPKEWKLYKEEANKSLIPLTSSSSSTHMDRSLLLPGLKYIVFKASVEFYPEFIQSLLQVSPNVKYVFNFPLHCIIKGLAPWMEPPVNNNNTNPVFQLDKIKSVHFSSSDRTPSAGGKMRRELSALAHISARMELSSAHLSFKMAGNEKSLETWTGCFESLSRIFQDNRNSIKFLKIEPFPLPQYLDYPEMPALKKLHLLSTIDWKKCEHTAKVCTFFPQEFTFLEAFPNLTKVKFEGTNCALGEFLEFFPTDIFQNENSGFQNVTSLNLKFQDLEDVESLQKVASLFPGVRKFSMDGDVRWLETRLLHILNLWPRLEILKLTVVVVMTATRLPSVQMYPLDSVFTGIPEAKCAELRESEEKRELKIHEWQEDFAISNMTELKELKLIFDGYFAKTQKVTPLFSHVTALYGFQLCPNLKVTFAIPFDNKDNEKIQKMLEPIQKYVDFQPNYH